MSGADVRRLVEAGVQRLLAPSSVAPVAESSESKKSKTKSLERDPVREADATIARIFEPGVPVIIGPFSSEVGYELLYWIPYLRWLVAREPRLKENLIVVSRGGTSNWYGDVSSQYEDIFQFVHHQTFLDRRRQAIVEGARKNQKQYAVTDMDQEIVDKVASARGLANHRLLHPSVMFDELRQLSKRFAHPRFDQVTQYEPFSPPPLGDLEGKLPDSFVAVKFYFNFPLRNTDIHRTIIRAVIRELAHQTDVVMLNTGMRFDDHPDFEPGESKRIHRFDTHMTPENNLGVQTAIVSRARAFVGTYGGLSYLPPFYRVPSLSLYGGWMKSGHHHLSLAQRVFRGDQWGQFFAMDIGEAPLLSLLQGAISFRQSSS